MDANDPLAAYNKRRRPPMGIYRRHRPEHRGGHLRPDEPRVLEEWDDFTYQVVGTAPNLAKAQNWVAELALDDGPAA
ncbi:DUF6087 family protein (plasmid) [Streptomyces sp. NBC_00984]|uniref:DUF6087 family protein n=1 Tax=Streptomyces sp. NBC_00984 TaxID=2903700 RepID=UPI002F9195C4|nr:DUF6087 family protein [Streptomyces sp. NBC_00984]